MATVTSPCSARIGRLLACLLTLILLSGPLSAWNSLEALRDELIGSTAETVSATFVDSGIPGDTATAGNEMAVVTQIYSLGDPLPEDLPMNRLDSRGPERVFPGWPGRVKSVNLDEKPAIQDDECHFDSTHSHGIFGLLATPGVTVEFHCGTAGDAFNSLKRRGASRVLFIRKVTPLPATGYFAAEFRVPGTPTVQGITPASERSETLETDPARETGVSVESSFPVGAATHEVFGAADEGITGFVTGTVGTFGRERFDHLLLQARAAFHEHGVKKIRVARHIHNPSGGGSGWHLPLMGEAIDQTLKLCGGKIDGAVIGYRGVLTDGILERVWSRRIFENLRMIFGSRPFWSLLSVKGETVFEAKEIEVIEGLSALVDNRLPEDFFTRPDLAAEFLAGVSQLRDLIAPLPGGGQPALIGQSPIAGSSASSVGQLASSDPSVVAPEPPKGFLTRSRLASALAFSRPLAEKVFIEAGSLDFLPHGLGFFRDRDGRIRSLLLFEGLHGSLAGDAVTLLAERGAAKLALFGPCKSIMSGAAPGDIFIPAAVDLHGDGRLGKVEFTNAIRDIALPKPSVKGCFGGSVFSTLAVTHDFLQSARNVGASFVDTDAFHFVLAASRLQGPAPDTGLVLISSGAPGREPSIDEKRSEFSSSVSNCMSRVFKARKAALPAIFDLLGLVDMVLPGEQDYPVERVGFFFGTFDPVHEGHLATAREAAAKLGLSRVLMVPNQEPAHKPGATPFRQRHAMLELALADEYVISTPDQNLVSRAFVEGGVTRVIAELKKIQGETDDGGPMVSDRFYQIMGTDSFEKLVEYGLVARVSGLHNMIVMRRPGYSMNRAGRISSTLRKGRIIEVDPDGVPLMSSTAVRKALSSGQKPQHLKNAVLDYILREGLYGAKDEAK